jgi:hypothetical protein
VREERKVNNMDFSSMDLGGLGNTAMGHYKAAEKHKEKADQQYIAAGIYLKEAKQRCLKTKGMTFEKFLRQHCPIGKSRAYEVIAIADGTKTIDEVREANANRQAAKRKRETSVRDVTDEQPIEKEEKNVSRPSENLQTNAGIFGGVEEDVVKQAQQIGEVEIHHLRKRMALKINLATYEQLLKIERILQ